MSFTIELGSKVQDRVTGFQGVVTGRTEYLYGCRRYVVQPVELKDGRPQDCTYFDEDALEVLEQAKPHKVKDTGGPREDEARLHRRQEPRR